MTKLRKMMMILVFTLAVVLGTTAGTGNAKAATTKNFKGNLNVTYKNSNSKITIKKLNSKKVSIQGIYSGYAKFKYTGKITSKYTIKFNAVNSKEAYVDVIFKWKDKSYFTSTWKEKRSNGLKYCSDELVFALDNTKYTQVQKSSTVYYGASHTKEKDEYGLGAVSKMTLKGNNLIVKGSLVRASSKKNLLNEDKRTLLKKATRTFKLDKNFKAYGCGGESPDQKLTTKEFKSSLKNANGLYLEFVVKNGKLTRLNFCS